MHAHGGEIGYYQVAILPALPVISVTQFGLAGHRMELVTAQFSMQDYDSQQHLLLVQMSSLFTA